MSVILVTGATGFVGLELVAALKADGIAVLAPPRRSIDLTTDQDWTPWLAGVSAVIHLAGIAHTDGIDDAIYDQVNHRATARLAEACAKARVKLVFVSSIRAQSGPTSDDVLDETMPPAPTDAYGRSKWAAEQAIISSGARFSILRPVLVIGPAVKGNLALLTKLARLPMPLPFASLKAHRSLVAIDDLITAIRLCLDNPATDGKTYIVAHPQPLTLPQMLAALREGMGRRPGLLPFSTSMFELLFSLIGRADQWQRLGGALEVDPAKLLAAGWTPRTPPQEALRQLTGRR